MILQRIFLESFLQTKLNDSRAAVSDLEIKMSESKGELSSMSKRLETLSTDNEKLTFQLAEMSGTAANNAQTLTKRNESLQKMVQRNKLAFSSHLQIPFVISRSNFWRPTWSERSARFLTRKSNSTK